MAVDVKSGNLVMNKQTGICGIIVSSASRRRGKRGFWVFMSEEGSHRWIWVTMKQRKNWVSL